MFHNRYCVFISRIRPDVSACFALLIAQLCLFGQQAAVRATVEGRVTESTSLPISGASIQLVDSSTNEIRTLAADTDGTFRISGLRVGTYELNVSAPGFSTYTQTAITLSVGQTVRVVVNLVPAQVMTQITVTAQPSMLDVSQTSLTSVIGHEQIEELPVRTRNALDFVLLAPGVSPANNPSASSQSSLAGSGFSFGGLRPRSNNVFIDGLDNNDEYAGSSRTELSPETVSEFQIVNNGISAEFGGASGGSVNVVTRSGTNQMHGDAFVFAQNGALNARPPLDDQPQKPDLSRYRTGLSNGGAIQKNSTFYYAAFEQEHRVGQEDSILDPSLTSLVNTYLANGAISHPATRGLNPGFSPTARAETEASGRFDRQFGSQQSLMLRYAFTNNREAGDAFHAGGLNDPSGAGSSFLRDHAVAGSLQSSISPSLVNDFRFQVARRNATLRTNDTIGPGVEIDGLLKFGRPYEGNSARQETHYEIGDTFSWNHGPHLFKAGVLINRIDLNSNAPDGFGGVYIFASAQAFFAGQPQLFMQTFGDPHTQFGVTSYGGFFQDHWTVTPHLTVDLGTRYDFEHLPETLNQDTNNISPRVGFAFSPNAKWVLRSGFGLFYDRYILANLNRGLEFNGRQAYGQIVNGAAAAALFQANHGESLAAPQEQLLRSLFRPDTHLATPYSAQASFAVQRQLTTNLTLGLSYLYVRGIKLSRTRNVNLLPPDILSIENSQSLGMPTPSPQQLNRPFFGAGRVDPNFDSIYQLENAASSTYHGLSASFSRRLADEIAFSVNYTLSRAMDDASDFNEQPQNPYDLRAERSVSRNDQLHRLVMNCTFDVPIGDEDAPRSPQGAFTRIFRNIEIAPIVSIESGQAVNVLTGVDSNRSHPWPLSARPAGFGRNSLRLPGMVTVDCRALKYFSVGEHARLDLVAELFNLLNRKNITQVNPYFGTGTVPLAGFTLPTQTMNARQLQFSLDFEY